MAIAVGALLALVAGGFAIYQGFGHYESRQDEVDKKRSELAQAKAELLQAEQKERVIKSLVSRSLSAKANEASNTYKEWLRQTLPEGNIFPDSITPSDTFIESGKEYGKLKFDVKASARLDDLTNWLHKFNTVNCLHRIKSLKLAPIDNSKLLSVNLEIETISLTKTTKDQSKPFEGRRIVGKTEADLKAQFAADHERLVRSVVGRNLFGPPNHEPTIMPIGKIPATVGKVMEVFVKGKDKKDGSNENDDEALLLYRVVDAEMSDYDFDVVKGALRWTPKKKGEYKATVEVTDNGIPRKMTRQTFTIVVNEAAKGPPPVTTPKSTFDVAKWAFVTAIVEEGGTGQVWINERSTGKSQKLKIGDAVQYGSIKGKVSRIDSTGVEVETGDAKFFTKVGQSLGVAASQAGGS